MTEQELESECVIVLRRLLEHGRGGFTAEDCQECSIGQSLAWRRAKQLIKQIDANEKEDANRHR